MIFFGKKKSHIPNLYFSFPKILKIKKLKIKQAQKNKHKRIRIFSNNRPRRLRRGTRLQTHSVLGRSRHKKNEKRRYVIQKSNNACKN